MTYTYSEVDGTLLDPRLVAYAERVRNAARDELGLTGRSGGGLAIRWYVAADVAGSYALATRDRGLDITEQRSLAGWHIEPPCIAVRADQSSRQVALTVAHETYHAFEDHHHRPYDEARAEHFARRLVAQLGEIR